MRAGWGWVSVGVAAAVMVAGVVWVALLLWSEPEAWQALMFKIEGWGNWIGVALIGLMVLHNVVPVPAELIAVTAGAMLGLVAGVVVIWLGAMIGAALAFWMARAYGRRVLQGPRTAQALQRFDQFVSAGNWHGLLVVRLIPIVSFNLVNYAAGVSGVGWRRFLWTTALGILPVTVLSVAAGAGLSVIGLGPALGVIAIVLLAGVVIRVFWVSGR